MGQAEEKTVLSTDGVVRDAEEATQAENAEGDTVARERTNPQSEKVAPQTLVAGNTENAAGSPTVLSQNPGATVDFEVGSPRSGEVPSLVGQIIGDHEILSELGRGGMGVVYKARNVKLGRVVALKMIINSAHADPDWITRFRNEAKAIARLQHPNIVQLLDFAEHEGVPYFSLHFIDGGSLEQRVSKNPMPAREAAAVVAKLAQAMQYAHDEGFIHRDLKPQNVLMSGNEPLVTDFGLAREIEADDGQTKTGTILGTPGYMSPQQANGEAKTLTAASDQYSLGAILYRLLAGRPPFVSSRTMDTIMQVIKSDPVPLRQLSAEVPVDLETICLKVLAKDPANRYESCQAMAADLNRFVRNEPIEARPISTLERLVRWYKRNPKIGTLVATSFGLLLALAGVMAFSSMAIAKERDNVKQQEQKAQENLVIAEQNEQKAKDNEKIARDQAVKIVKAMQSIIVDVDGPLKQDPNFANTRLQIMKSLSQAFNDLEIELHTDVKSEAMPTFMAMRFQMVRIFSSLNEGDLAQEEVRKLYELGKQRIRIKEGTDAARENLVTICLQHAEITSGAEGIEAAKPLLKEALETARDIIANPKPADDPNTPGLYHLKYILSNALQSWGVHHYRLGEPEDAAGYFKEAGDVRREVLSMLGADEKFKTRAAGYQKMYRDEVSLNARRSTLGASTVLLKAGKVDEGLAEYQKVYDAAVALAKAEPSEKNRVEAANIQRLYGYRLFRNGKTDDGLKLLREGTQVAKEAAKRNEDDYQSQYNYSVALYQLGTVLESKGLDESRAYFADCVTVREALREKNANLKNETMLMIAYARAGKPEAAEKIASRLNENAKLEGKHRVDIARAYSQSSRFLDDVDRSKLLISQSVTVLRQAIADGYQDWHELSTEPDFDPVRELDAFRKMVADLKAK